MFLRRATAAMQISIRTFNYCGHSLNSPRRSLQAPAGHLASVTTFAFCGSDLLVKYRWPGTQFHGRRFRSGSHSGSNIIIFFYLQIPSFFPVYFLYRSFSFDYKGFFACSNTPFTITDFLTMKIIKNRMFSLRSTPRKMLNFATEKMFFLNQENAA